MTPLKFPVAPASSALAQLIHICQQLHTCSDEELQTQLRALACTQPAELVQSVRFLLHNSQYVAQQLGAPEAAAATPAPPEPAAALLSAREREVLRLLAEGYTLPRIAGQLFISAATVNNHCAKMREKLGLRGRNALMAYAVGLKGG